MLNPFLFSVLTVLLFYHLYPHPKQAKLQSEKYKFPSTTNLHQHRASYSLCSVLNTLKESKHSAEQYTKPFQITAAPTDSWFPCHSPGTVFCFIFINHFQTYRIQKRVFKQLVTSASRETGQLTPNSFVCISGKAEN